MNDEVFYNVTPSPKFYFMCIHKDFWAFYYYGNLTGCIQRRLTNYPKYVYELNSNDSYKLMLKGEVEYEYTVSLEHVFWVDADWKKCDFGRSGDHSLIVPSRGEAKKFLRENAKLSDILKLKYGSNSHLSDGIDNWSIEYVPQRLIL